MTQTRLFFCVLFLLFLVSPFSNSFGQKPKFVKLFNGKDLANWDLKIRTGDSALAKRIFAVENGVVHVFSDYPDSTGLDDGKNLTHAMMYTKKKYSRFIFKFEYKWGTKKFNNFGTFQYDAGMYYHVPDNIIWPKGIEYQVRYDHLTNTNHTGDFWSAVPNFQWYSEDGKTFMLPENGGTPQPIKQKEHLAMKTTNFNGLNDKWNTCEVIVMGNRYAIHKLNGEIVNVGTNLSVGEGTIGLQAETAEIFYRNIMIKEFTEDIPIEQFTGDKMTAKK